MSEPYDAVLDHLAELAPEDRDEQWEERFIHRPHLRLMTARDWDAAETREEGER